MLSYNVMYYKPMLLKLWNWAEVWLTGRKLTPKCLILFRTIGLHENNTAFILPSRHTKNEWLTFFN